MFINFGYRKSLGEKGEYQNFPSKVICLTVSKSFLVEPFPVSQFSGTEKLSASEGYVTTFHFLSKIFCLTVPKGFVAEPFCGVVPKKFRKRKSLWIGGGSIKIYRRKLFVSQCRKIS